MPQLFFHLAAQVLILALCGTGSSRTMTHIEHTLTGEFRTHKDFHSRFLSIDRDVLVYLPPGYDAHSLQRYPVLYLHDGQNLFDGATSYIPGMEWRVDETAQTLIESHIIRPLIIVGIYNAGMERVNEYTPTRDARHNAGGHADLYGRMIVEELKPFIDAHYRTLKDARHTGIGGSSLGGLVSLHLGLKYPQTFGQIAVMSPSVWWDDKAIVREVQTLKTKPLLDIWLDMGTKEGGAATITNARLLRDALTAKGWRQGADLMYVEAEGATHNEAAWAARIGDVLKYFSSQR
ncbi:MAG: alpha/beta hydrolase [Pyrinomonadaceae bacterium]